FGPSKISLEKIPFWDRHKETPINTSGFQHVGWIVQNTNQHVWILVRRLYSTSSDITIAFRNFIFRCTNHSIVQLSASTFRPITLFGLFLLNDFHTSFPGLDLRNSLQQPFLGSVVSI